MSLITELTELEMLEQNYLEKASNSQLDDKTANAGYNNYTKYWRDIYPKFQGQAWCLDFQIWCFVKKFGEIAAKKLLCSEEKEWTFYTPTQVDRFKSKGQYFTSNPKEGDLIFFKNSERVHHVGYVRSVSRNNVYTVEGNTSAGVQVVPNGGGVFAKSYALNNPAIDGYGRPDYSIVNKEGRWIQVSSRYKYEKPDGSLAHNEWQIVNGHWYLFDSDGWMKTGLVEWNGERYFLENTPGAKFEGACCRTNDYGALKIWDL